MKKVRSLSTSAVLSALGVVILLLGSVIQVLDLSMAVIASIIIIYAVIELRGYWPYLIYAVTSLLSLLLLPDKFVAVVYALFCGYYPALKFIFEKKLPRIAEWTAKLAVFNLSLSAVVFISVRLLHIPETELFFGWLLYVGGNFVFVIYDMALTNLISFYFFKLKKRLGIKK
ncbi:MAG: hypothetical protein IJD17_06000 [Clostridia bacterium]|nr:hypothetical protein [Clostridia bacterium]